MRIAIAGATGALGRHVVDAAREAGHEPVPMSRSTGVDVTTGSGLVAALAGCDAVIDASSRMSTSAKRSREFFGAATRRLLDAERAAGVSHHVAISIIGAAQVPAAYYAGKALQEQLLMAESGGWSLLRTTQFHDFAAQLIGQVALGKIQMIPRMRSQPIAAREVADALVAIAAGAPVGLAPDLAGPREENLADLVRRTLAATGRRDRVWEVPLPGAWGRGMRDGSLLPQPGTRLGTRTFDEWLAETTAAAG